MTGEGLNGLDIHLPNERAQHFARFVQMVDSHHRAAHDGFHLPPNRPCVVPLIAFTPPH